MSKSIKNIWLISREYAGIAEAGGVKNVTCSLCEGLSCKGMNVTLLIPRYKCTDFSSVTDNAIASIGGSCYGLSSDQYQNGPFYSLHKTTSGYSTLSCKPSVKGES